MIELRPEEHGVARPLYADYPYKRAFIASAFEGLQRAKIFVDSTPNPLAAVLFHSSSHALLVGDRSCDNLWNYLSDLTPRDVFGRDRLLFVAPDEQWDAKLKSLKSGSLKEEARVFFSFPGLTAGHADGEDVHDDQPVPARITANLLATPRGMLGGVLWHWPTAEAFDEHGIGRCILDDSGEPISVCYSVTVGERMAPIQITTLPEYRRRGYATRVARAYIDDALRKGIAPFWECGIENTPSATLAKSLGFQPAGHLSRFWLVQTDEQ